MRTTLTCTTILICLALAACGDDTGGTGNATTTGPTSDPATTGDTTAGPSTSSTSSDDPTTGGDDNSASGTTTASTTSTASTTTADDTTSTTTTPPGTTTTGDDTTSGDDTTGGTMVGCGLEGPEVEATLVHVGDPPPPCGTLEFIGSNYEMNTGPVYNLDGCPCNSDCFAPDPWTFTLDVPDGAFLPAVMPICPRIVVERQMSKKGCELVGVTIFETDFTTFPNPYYVAGSLLGPPAAAAADLSVEQTVVETCDCDFCCNSPERYDLEFELGGEMLSLAEDSFGVLGDPNIPHYAVSNFQSHYSGTCDDSPAIDWVVNMIPLN